MAAVWAVNFIVVKLALAHLSPLAFNGIRFPLAAAAMAVIALRNPPLRLSRADIVRLIGLGLLGNFAYQVCFIEGIARTRAGNAAILLAGVPVFTAVLSQMLGTERHGGRSATALALASLGVAILVIGGAEELALRGTLLGDLLVLTGTACWAAFTVGIRPLVARLGAVRTTAWTMVSGALPLLGAATPSVLDTPWTHVPLWTFAAIAFSALGALVFAYLIWARGVRLIGATRTAVFSYLTPVLTVLIAWPWLGEVPSPAQGVGAACIFVGVGLALGKTP
jgi:drug/metabolite transporter (DMT)-like permease